MNITIGVVRDGDWSSVQSLGHSNGSDIFFQTPTNGKRFIFDTGVRWLDVAASLVWDNCGWLALAGAIVVAFMVIRHYSEIPQVLYAVEPEPYQNDDPGPA
jgi:hypothetical protein